MNPYPEPPGIFGTGASLLADLTLIAYLLILIPAMAIGCSYARRGKHRPQHRWVMTGVTFANWLLIAFLTAVPAQIVALVRTEEVEAAPIAVFVPRAAVTPEVMLAVVTTPATRAAVTPEVNHSGAHLSLGRGWQHSADGCVSFGRRG